MEKKRTINLGFRGWMLLIYQFIAFFTFIIFTNWPMNILADLFGGAQKISTIYTAATLVGIVFQLIFSRFVGRIKNIKVVGVIFGFITLLFGLAIMLIPMTQPTLWQVAYFFLTLFSVIYCTLLIGILVGQWFPRRKGTIMGIATIAFPIGNGLLGTFAGLVFSPGGTVFSAFLPFFIICAVGLLIGAIFVKDYPEQCGAFRDNDRSITPEVGKAMMEHEIEAKRTSVWGLRHTLGTRDFWFMVIPMGALLMCAVGMMTQSMSIVANQSLLSFNTTMLLVMVIASVGSWLLGVIDTKFGTKKAVTLSVVIMIVSGILGSIKNDYSLISSLFLLAIFMGASSNFTVSAAAQYWRREDFPRVFSYVNPTANIIQAMGPMMVTYLTAAKDYRLAFTVTAVIGVVSLILVLAFSSKHVKVKDDKYRSAAGKTMDDALVGRL